MKHLRHRTVIQVATDSVNSYGENTESWATLATVWARFTPKAGREDFEAGSEIQATTYDVEMWYLSTVTTKNRLVYDSRTFEIESITNTDEKNRKMILTCTEKE